VGILYHPKSFTGGSKPSATTKVAPTMLRDNFAKSIKKDPEAYPAFKEAWLVLGYMEQGASQQGAFAQS